MCVCEFEFTAGNTHTNFCFVLNCYIILFSFFLFCVDSNDSRIGREKTKHNTCARLLCEQIEMQTKNKKKVLEKKTHTHNFV